MSMLPDNVTVPIQDGDKLTVQVIVGPGGKFANETTTTMIGGEEEFEYKDKDGPCRGLSKWNEDKTQIISDAYRVGDAERKYKSLRYMSVMSDDKMIIETTNKHNKTLTQNFEREKAKK